MLNFNTIPNFQGEGKSACQFSNGYVVDYSHDCQIRDLEIENFSPFTIRNVVCSRVGDAFRKITEIQIGNKMVTLFDSYRFSREPTEEVTQETRSESELEIHQTRGSSEDTAEGHSDDRKNAVKNIIKSFERNLWKKSRKDTSLVDEYKMLKTLLRRNKFNNKLVQKIVMKPRLSEQFRAFLDHDAMVWLNESKINDKETTQKTINLYIKMCQTGEKNLIRTSKPPKN